MISSLQLRTPDPGFAKIAVRAEVFRVIVLNALVLGGVITGLVRSFIAPDQLPLRWFHFLLMLIPVLFGAVSLVLIRPIVEKRGRLPVWLWVPTFLIECMLPTAIIVMLWKWRLLPPAAALTSPAVMAYFLVLILSTLRLNPWLSVLAGLLCSAQYTSIILLVDASVQTEGQPPLQIGYLLSYAAWLVICGIAAAAVAWVIRVHIRTQLRESEGRQRAEREIALAAEVQRGLLPKSVPSFDGYDVAFWNRPADQTGGDYCDWQVLPDGKLVVSVADVTGHGLGPALIAAFCRAYARAAILGLPSLEAAISRVNRLIADDLTSGRFVTFAAALLTPGSSDVLLVSAGHGPILIRRGTTGVVESRPADGLPLGIDANIPLDAPKPVRLEPGDALVLITDGFFEWVNAANEQFGIERLSACVSASRADPEALIESMRAGVEGFAAGTTQGDDLTAVTIVRRAPGARAAG